MLNPAESATLNQALTALNEEAGLDLMEGSTLSQEAQTSNRADVLLETPKQTFAIEVKRHIGHAHLGAIIQQVKTLKPHGLLVADYINPNIAKRLKEHDIQYLDTCGNCYLNVPPLFIHVSGHKPATHPKRETNSTFKITGLKLIYGLLSNGELVNASYREISQQTGVALGAIGSVLSGLQDAGYVINKGKSHKRVLVKRRKLLDRWVESYPEKLKPKLLMGEFISANVTWWNTFELTRFGAYWSGEVGAAKYTQYLKPQEATVYLPEASGNELFAAAKLKKASAQNERETGKVHIYRPFWPDSLTTHTPNPHPDTVHPILIYADLIASQDSRNLEAARMLYDQAIAGFIGED